MTENVHKRLESMEDLDILSQSNIYSGNELRTIINKRREFEHKVNGPIKNLKDFKEYIAFEINLQKLITIKKDALSKNVYNDLNFKLLSKIKSLFEIALIRFATNEETYFLYFQFCKRTYFKESSKICDKMLKHHPNNEKMWCLAAEWYAHDRKEFSFALKLLQQGIAMHKTSKLLYKECLKYEILNYEANESENNCERLVKRLEIYCNDMFEKIDDLEHYIAIFKWAEEYNFLQEIKMIIMKFVKEKYNNNHNLWIFLIQKETKAIVDKTNEVDVINSSLKIFENGLKEVSEKNIQPLWNLLLAHFDELLSNRNFDKAIILNKLLTLYKKASDEGFLTEENHIKWIERAPENEKRAILNQSVLKHSKSLTLWKLWLRCLILEETHDEIPEYFDRAFNNVEDNVVDLYLLLENYHVTSSSDDEIIAFYHETLTTSCAQVKNAIKPKYILWLSESKGIDTCREAYKKLVKEKPYCKLLYQAMCQIEASQKTCNLEEFDSILKLGCDQFGRDSIDVWVNYTKFILFNHKDLTYKEKLHDIWTKARSDLPDYLFVQFDTEYKTIFNKFEKLLSEL